MLAIIHVSTASSIKPLWYHIINQCTVNHCVLYTRPY